MRGPELFILIMFFIPLYGILIYSYVYPEDSHLFFRRWMYEEDPELNESAVAMIKKANLIALIIMTLMLLLAFYRIF